MRHGERQRFLVGTGHGGCTCEGAAFEYVVNLEFELRARGVRDKADIVFLTNEYELGDLGLMAFISGRAATLPRAASSPNLCSPSVALTGSPRRMFTAWNPGKPISKRWTPAGGMFPSISACFCRPSPESG